MDEDDDNKAQKWHDASDLQIKRAQRNKAAIPKSDYVFMVLIISVFVWWLKSCALPAAGV